MNLNIISAFVKKESREIVRDFSSVLTAFILPLILLVLFGYGINFDTNTVKIGVVDLDNTNITRSLRKSLETTRFLDVLSYKTVKMAFSALKGGEIKAITILPVDFTKEYKKKNAKVQIITDGSEPNSAKFATSYIEGAINSFMNYEQKKVSSKNINLVPRIWYNPSLYSLYFILPGSLAIVMTLTGVVLTALVIAREWEKGTMEAILTTEITKGEFLISKYISYFILSFFSVLFCLFLIIFVFKVPFKGSYFWLFLTSSLFMLTGIGSGLFISAVMKDQFTSSQIAGTVGFMPAMMLSGLIYEIDSTPFFIRFLSWFFPAKYYVSSITSLFLSGNIFPNLIYNSLFLLFFSVVVGVLTYLVLDERLEKC